jgi:vacuolar protein-sorting-associated protein 4
MSLPYLNFYDKASILIKQGLELDESNQSQSSLPFYTKGLEYLFAGAKYDPVRNRREHKLSLVKFILERAEHIKEANNNTTSRQQTKSPTPTQRVNSPTSATSTPSSSSTTKKSNEKQQSNEVIKLREALKNAVVIDKPDIKWSDVAGLENAKKALEEAIVLPRKYPQLFVGKRSAWKAVLLYGPPGTGKSFLAKAAASNLGEGATFYSISSADLMSKWQGESEKLVKQLFEMAAETAPSVIFIDEIDAICSRRGTGSDEHESSRRMKNELLVQMQEAKPGVFVLAATNRPYSLDPALRRRFDKRIYIPLPDEAARYHILQVHVGKEPTALTADDYKYLANRTAGYSAADLSVVVRDALMQPIRQAMRSKAFKRLPSNHLIACDINDKDAIPMTLFDMQNPSDLIVPDINIQYFKQSLESIKPSVSLQDVEDTDRFTQEFGEGEIGVRPVNTHVYTSKATPKQQIDRTNGTDLRVIERTRNAKTPNDGM